MKRILALILCVIFCITPIVACGGTGDTTTSSEPEEVTTTYDYERIPDVIEPHETRTVTKDELGYRAAVIAGTSKYWVADGKIDEMGSLIITSYNPGTTVITVKNSYSEKIELTVTVGLDFGIEAVDFTPYAYPEVYANAAEYGASPSLVDNAPKIQAAIDAVVAKGGGTVYIPRGRYKSNTIVLKENVTLRLEGVLDDYNTDFSAKVSSRVLGSGFAVIEALTTDMFFNHTPRRPGREGCDNFAIIGGCLDMQGKRRCFIWCCADNVLLENVVMKDCPNNHAIQITGSTNVTIRDCMFVGYNVGTNITTAETIQIEQAHPGAIGGTISPFEENEFYYSKNVTIENCYFGKSEKYGSHTFPIGHHGSGSDSCSDIKIIGNTFDDPKIVAIRAYAWNNLEIAHNKFINEEKYDTNQGRSLIELTFAKGAKKLANGAYISTEYTRGATQNINIHDNEFVIGADSNAGGILSTVTDNSFLFDFQAERSLKMAESYNTAPFLFNGYLAVKNIISDVRVCDNKITVNNPKCRVLYTLSNVKGVEIRDNEIEGADSLVSGKLDGVDIAGAKLLACTSADHRAKNFIVSATSKNVDKPIVMSTGVEGESIEVFCTASNRNAYFNLIFKTTEGGGLGREATSDGLLYVNPVCDEGYVFDGYYVGDSRIELGRFDFTGTTVIEARFAAAE